VNVINNSKAITCINVKRCLKLVKEDGLKYREVADILNISVKNRRISYKQCA